MSARRSLVLSLGLVVWLSLAGSLSAAIKGELQLYPAVPLTHATSCPTNVTTAYQDQICIDPSGIWICKTPAAGGATDIANNPLCNQSAEWELVTSVSTGAIAWSGDITPPQITAAQHNYTPTGLSTASVLRLSTNATQDLTGIAGGLDGRWLVLVNVGSQSLTLRSESSSSTPANRFALTADITMLPNALVLLLYDITGPNPRWRALFSSVTATGGGGDVEKLPVAAATTGNITLSNPGTAVFDGVTLVNGQRLLVWQQVTQTQNGCYQFNGAGVPLTRTTDCDADTDFINNFTIKVQAGGTLYGGVTFMLQNTGLVTVGPTNIIFAVESWGSRAEVLANKNVVSGYAGLTSTGKLSGTQLMDYAAHPALAAPTTINPTIGGALRTIVGIQSTAGAGLVDLTSTPQITPGTVDSQLLILVGLHPTDTVQIDNGTGVRLCGNAGSIIIGQNASTLTARWNTTLSVWEQIGCVRDIFGSTTIGTSVRIGKDGSDHWRLYCTDTECFQETVINGAVSPNSTIKLGTGGALAILNNASTSIGTLTEVTGAWINTTIDVEATGNTFTSYDEDWFDAAGCQNVTAGHIWDTPTTDVPTPTCDSAGPGAYLAFNDTTDQSIRFKFRLPTGFTGAIDWIFRWKSVAISPGTVGWCVQLGRSPLGSGSFGALPAKGAGNCVSDTAAGSTLQENEATINGVTCGAAGGCTAGDLIYGAISRNASATAVPDSMSGNALLIGWTRRVRSAK